VDDVAPDVDADIPLLPDRPDLLSRSALQTKKRAFIQQIYSSMLEKHPMFKRVTHVSSQTVYLQLVLPHSAVFLAVPMCYKTTSCTQ